MSELRLKCQTVCNVLMIVSDLNDKEIEFYHLDNDEDVQTSVWINKDQAQQIITHLKEQFEL